MSSVYHHHLRGQSRGWWNRTGLTLPASSTPARFAAPPPGPPLRCSRTHDTKKALTRLCVVDEVFSGGQSRHLILQVRLKDTAISRQHQETLWKDDRRK